MRLGFYYVLSVPYAAGLACLGGPYVGGFRLTGWVFAVMLAAAPLVYLFDRAPSRFPIWIWMPWILIVILSLAWADEFTLSHLQDVCQIITPFVIAPIASKAMRSAGHLDVLLRSFFHCMLILLGGLSLHFIKGVFILERPMAMTATVVGCVFVSQIRERRKSALIGWSGCLLVAGLTASRMATLVLLMEWLILPRYRRQSLRLIAAVLIVASAVALFYTPIFQERFFHGDRGTLQDIPKGEFSSAGRFEAWTVLWREVARRPLLGAGAHSSAEMVSRVWHESDKPHNDYLRILLEQGAVGLTCFLFGVAGQLLSLRFLRSPGGGQQEVVQSAAYMGILVFLMMAVTDNPIIYGVWFLHPLFVLIGASYPATTNGWVTDQRNGPSMTPAGKRVDGPHQEGHPGFLPESLPKPSNYR